MRDSAVDAFVQAASLDSGFTLPLIMGLEARFYSEIQYEDYKLRLRVLEQHRRELPRWQWAMLDYHLARQAQGLPEQYEALRRGVAISPGPEWTFQLAAKAVETNRPREAVELLTRLESERDWLEDRPGYWMWLVDAKLLLGDYEAVIGDIDRARVCRAPQDTESLKRSQLRQRRDLRWPEK